MSIYKDKKSTKDGRCWYFKVNYTGAFGKPDQYKSKKFTTKKEAVDAERMFMVTSTDIVEDNNIHLKIYMMS